MNVNVQQERRGWFGRRRRVEPEDRALTAANVPPVMLPTTIGASTVTPSNALAIADVFACIRCLSDAAASIPLISYRKTATGRTRVDGPLSDLLRAPAPATTQANLVGQAVAHLNLYGNCYVGKFRDVDGKVSQLALLHPDRVTPELRAGIPVYTVSDGHGRRSEHGTDDIIHIRGLSTDGLLGLSPVGQCRVAMGLSQSLALHAAQFFESGARPVGILRVPGASQEAMEVFGARFGAQNTGMANAHRIAVISAEEIDFTQLTGPLDDLQFVEQRHLSTAEIARIFRVPPWMVGASSGDSMTYSNTEQQGLAFVTWSLRPWLVLIEQAITADVDLSRGNLFVEFLIDALERADSTSRAAIYTQALDPATGWMTRAEVRRLENLEPESTPPPVQGATIA